MEVSFRGGKIHYSDIGAGKVIVLIHGYLETMNVWESFSERLALQFRVLSIDLPGHGYSTLVSELNSMELFAESVKAVLDSLNIKKSLLIGHSMGGYATLAFLRMFPEYLYGYSLFHSHPLADTPDSIERRKASIAIVKKGEKDLMIPGFIRNLYAPSNIDRLKDRIEKSISIASGIKGETVIADLNGMLSRPDGVSLVEKGIVPFLWILGKSDSHINCDTIQKRLMLPGNSKVVILARSGHSGFIEEEELSAKIVTDFINSLDSALTDWIKT